MVPIILPLCLHVQFTGSIAGLALIEHDKVKFRYSSGKYVEIVTCGTSMSKEDVKIACNEFGIDGIVQDNVNFIVISTDVSLKRFEI